MKYAILTIISILSLSAFATNANTSKCKVNVVASSNLLSDKSYVKMIKKTLKKRGYTKSATRGDYRLTINRNSYTNNYLQKATYTSQLYNYKTYKSSNPSIGKGTRGFILSSGWHAVYKAVKKSIKGLPKCR